MFRNLYIVSKEVITIAKSVSCAPFALYYAGITYKIIFIRLNTSVSIIFLHFHFMFDFVFGYKPKTPVFSPVVYIEIYIEIFYFV